MALEDKTLAMAARHACARTALDISELSITSNKGVVTLTGKVRPNRDAATIKAVDPRKEFEILKQAVRNVRGVKELIAEYVRVND